MVNKVVWFKSTWGEDFAPLSYYGSIPLVLPVGAVLEVTRRSNKRNHTTTEVVTVRMPRKKALNE